MFRSGSAFVATVWWLLLVAHFGIAILITVAGGRWPVAGGQGPAPAFVVWVGWGTLVAHYFARRWR